LYFEWLGRQGNPGVLEQLEHALITTGKRYVIAIIVVITITIIVIIVIIIVIIIISDNDWSSARAVVQIVGEHALLRRTQDGPTAACRYRSGCRLWGYEYAKPTYHENPTCKPDYFAYTFNHWSTLLFFSFLV